MGLLIKCLRLFKLNGLIIVDSKPIETKSLARFGRHAKSSRLALIRGSIGFNPLKGVLRRLKATCCTDSRYMSLLYVDQQTSMT